MKNGWTDSVKPLGAWLTFGSRVPEPALGIAFLAFHYYHIDRLKFWYGGLVRRLCLFNLLSSALYTLCAAGLINDGS